MTLQDLSWIVVVNGLAQLTGLVLLGAILIRGQREIARIARAVGAMVYQEEEKTRTRLEELGSRLLGERR